MCGYGAASMSSMCSRPLFLLQRFVRGQTTVSLQLIDGEAGLVLIIVKGTVFPAGYENPSIVRGAWVL